MVKSAKPKRARRVVERRSGGEERAGADLIGKSRRSQPVGKRIESNNASTTGDKSQSSKKEKQPSRAKLTKQIAGQSAPEESHAATELAKQEPWRSQPATKDFQTLIERWRKLVQDGSTAFDSERYVIAETCFKEALSLAEQLTEGFEEERETANVSLTKSLNNLACLYHVQGKYGMAEELYDRCLDLKLKMYGEEHLEVAVNMHNLAVLFSAKRMFFKAEILYKRALEIREKLLGTENKELVPILRNYALLLKKANRKKEASRMEERAAAIEAG